MKITKSQANINSFGGINFANLIINNIGVFDLIDQMLGNRGLTSTYKYSDLFRSYFLMTLCGGECAEDITEHLRSELNQVKDFKVCSADTLLRMQKELATEKEIFTAESGIKHELNTHLKMNELLVKTLLKTKQLSAKKKDYIFDYDNQFIPTEKYDSKRSYKQKNGYFPGIASIDNHPVYVENRNGNSQVKYKQSETLQRAFGLLKDNNIKIKHSRMDCGSFDKKVIEIVEENSEFFYIRAQRCASLYEAVQNIDSWETIYIGVKQYEIASIDYQPFGEKKKYRYVITREPQNTNQGDLFTGDSYKYRAIITNNREMSDYDVVVFYNKRGDSERLFDEMNNDFLWKKMPFSFLNENTVFLIMMAICRNLFYYLTKFINSKLDFIKPNFRLKKFIFRFMIVPSKWLKRGRQQVLKLYSDVKYELLV